MGRHGVYGGEGGGASEGGGWHERVVSVSEFIRRFLVPSVARQRRPRRHCDGGDVYATLPEGKAVGYLAQHSLFRQLPELRADFCTPPYCADAATRVNCWWGTDGTVTPLHFDSGYFKLLLDCTWVNASSTTGLAQYACDEAPGLVMLHTDRALIDDALFRTYVEHFATNEGAFFAAFATAFQTLLENSHTGLVDVFGDARSTE